MHDPHSLHTSTFALSFAHHIFFLSEGHPYPWGLFLLCTWHLIAPFVGAVMSNRCPQGFLPQICQNGVQERPTNQRYPLDIYLPKYQEHHGTPRINTKTSGKTRSTWQDHDHQQDQVFWQDQDKQWNKPTTSYCRKVSYHVNYMINTWGLTVCSPQFTQFISL